MSVGGNGRRHAHDERNSEKSRQPQTDGRSFGGSKGLISQPSARGVEGACLRARTCADEEHVVDPLVQRVDPVHRQPGEVDALGEQQGASQGLVRHQRVLLGEVECGVGQQQRAVVAALPVVVGDALAGRKRKREEEGGGGDGRP